MAKIVKTTFAPRGITKQGPEILFLGHINPFVSDIMIYYCLQGSRPIADGIGRSCFLFACLKERAIGSN